MRRRQLHRDTGCTGFHGARTGARRRLRPGDAAPARAPARPRRASRASNRVVVPDRGAGSRAERRRRWCRPAGDVLSRPHADRCRVSAASEPLCRAATADRARGDRRSGARQPVARGTHRPCRSRRHLACDRRHQCRARTLDFPARRARGCQRWQQRRRLRIHLCDSCVLVRPCFHRRHDAKHGAAGRPRLFTQGPSPRRRESLLLVAATRAGGTADATAAPNRSTASAGSITSGRARRSIRMPRAGTGST